MSVIQREETVKSTFKLEGLHCASCAAKIEQAAAEMEGVSGAFLDLLQVGLQSTATSQNRRR